MYSPFRLEGISSSSRIIHVACGLQHTLLLDSTGRVFGLGRSDDGRLGNLANDVLIPRQIDGLFDIVSIAAGGSVSFAMDSRARVYSFGMGDTCQTGHGNQDVFVPTRIQGKQLERRRIEHISVGAQHTLFLVRDENDAES